MIDRDSTSYPYLAIAQRTGAPYGTVLAYVSALEKGDEREGDEFRSQWISRLDYWEKRAVLGLPTRVQCAIVLVRNAELRRRDAVLKEARS